MGRLIGHIVQWLVMTFNTWPVWDRCSRIGDATCIQPGVYALIAAGSTMCGVTRLSVTLAGKHKTPTSTLSHPLRSGILQNKSFEAPQQAANTH